MYNPCLATLDQYTLEDVLAGQHKPQLLRLLQTRDYAACAIHFCLILSGSE